MGKKKDEKGKCKACIMFKGKINSMSMFKKTWMDGYNGGRLALLKCHCSGKPNVKTLRSFKASVLKTPAEVDQKEVDTSVSLDEFKRL